MNKKVYLIQPTYRDKFGKLLKGKSLYTISLALPSLSATIPPDWEKQLCYEFFEDVDFDTDASIIGISSMGYEIYRGIELAKEFRRRGKTVIFGGFQAHMSTDFVAPHCDAVVHGNPGIPAMKRILEDAYEGKLQRDYHCGVDLDYQVDYRALDTRRVLFTPVFTSVGCNYLCDYCCIASIYKGNCRVRKLRHVFAELEYLHGRTRRIAFMDTNIHSRHTYLKALCEGMIERGFRFVWGAQATIDIGDDEHTLRLLRRAGCKALFIGLESFSQANLEAVNKGLSAETYGRRIRNIHRAGIKIAAFLMYGFDHDTQDTAAELSRLVTENRIALPMINLLVPLPGTVLFERLRAENRLLIRDEGDFLRNNIGYNSSFNLCLFRPKHMTPDEAEEGFIELLGRLSGYGQIIRRSFSRDLKLSVFFLHSNWLFRREYIRLRKLRSKRLAVAVDAGGEQRIPCADKSTAFGRHEGRP
ncbi:MAG: radical SAM protein [Bacteroidetes bacterium]|nr:radical SAM protein [Bacteroidota bacterium]